MEVILVKYDSKKHLAGFLHVCGGDPRRYVVFIQVAMFSPRMWRWSYSASDCWSNPAVFSTYVEVIPWGWLAWKQSTSFLHVCGGDPTICDDDDVDEAFSPRMWRWSLWRSLGWRFKEVFSTYVEVILDWHIEFNPLWSFLHVCGGDPEMTVTASFSNKFSPRMWRWSCVNSWNF